MTDLTNRRSYNLGDTFGDPVETDSVSAHEPIEGPWCKQADGILEREDAFHSQGGSAQISQELITNHKGNSINAYES